MSVPCIKIRLSELKVAYLQPPTLLKKNKTEIVYILHFDSRIQGHKILLAIFAKCPD